MYSDDEQIYEIHFYYENLIQINEQFYQCDSLDIIQDINDRIEGFGNLEPFIPNWETELWAGG